MSQPVTTTTAEPAEQTALQDDPRIRAFCSPAAPDLFHSVAHQHQIWKHDPYDVETIHAEARAAFERLLERATTPPGLNAGRILLLKGESGSGKTHLMRAFRNYVHGRRLGYCGYLQMTSSASNYGRYLLSNLIDSLDHSYCEQDGETSGLMRLANALAETPHSILPQELATLREADLDPSQVTRLVYEMAENVFCEDRFASLDLDLIRALLYLQRGDARIKKRVLAYIRCEDLSDFDRQVLGGIVPRKNEEDPMRVAEHLGRLMWDLQSAVLVVCIDQLEGMHERGDDGERFRRAMATVCNLANHLPSSVWVIACLEDLYDVMRPQLTGWLLDRIEVDPEPVRLDSRRSVGEARELVQRRLEHLYDSLDAPFREEDPTFPFPSSAVDRLANTRTRDVLAWCGKHREKCIRAGAWVPLDGPGPVIRPDDRLIILLEQRWNDFLSHRSTPLPDGDAELASLLAQAIEACAQEVPTGHWFSTETHDRIIDVELHGPENQVDLLVVGLCNKEPRGGGLGRQIREVEERAGEHTPVIVRSTDFPSNPRAEVTKQIGKLITRGGRRAVVEDTDWRTMLAFQEFRQQHGQKPEFPLWLEQERPVSQLKSLRSILGLDSLRTAVAQATRREPPPSPPAAPAGGPPSPPAAAEIPPAKGTDEDTGLLELGSTGGRQPTPVRLDPQDLTQHAAFLGGSGSGKTTVALNVIEQLLLRGIPAVLIDRKGDLCGYSRADVWVRTPQAESLSRRRDRLRELVDVAVFTPGNPAGHALSIPLVPDGIGQLPTWEREHLAGYAAFALGGMMAYKDRGQDASRLAILKQAIMLLTAGEGALALSLGDLIDCISGPDPSLLAAIGQLDGRLCRRLVQDLETLRLNKSKLLSAEGDRLDTELLLGLGRHARPGKTRLSVVSTKFLGDNAHVEFWVAQLLLELTRWASKSPSARLQAVVLFDEADLYLPAQRKPPTKEPMENLLKRARSAGVGVLLASQSPGDLDYKCRDNIRTWFLGRITQQTSLAKMKPLLSDCRVDIADKLPSQRTGQFHLVRDGGVVGLQAARSWMTTEQLSEDQILKLACAAASPGQE